MTDENKQSSQPRLIDRRQKSVTSSQEENEFRQTIADLLLRVDHEAEQFRIKIAELLAGDGALLEAKESKSALETLVVKLREANQHLVRATLGAQEMQAQAESVNQRQEEFLAMLAHELRNPLAPIAMAADLIGKISMAHPSLPKLHGILSRQTRHMSHLVDDLLDASRASTGKITLQKCPILLSEIIESAVETSQPFIDKRSQKLTIILPDDAIVINGDLVRLAQVFANLLINATKFTPVGGHIDILAQRLTDTVKVSIKDDGVGIALDIQSFIFDLFRQGPQSLDRSQGGLGIGLSLARTVIEMHTGTVDVNSAGVGCGSEFIMELPISPKLMTDNKVEKLQANSAHGCRILLIEDNLSANEILSDLLRIEGYTVTSAFDGRSGLAMAKENMYDVIVCDIGLPEIDGYEVLRQLRILTGKSLPLCIAISGYSQQENKMHAESASFDHYLVKPVTIAALTELIASRSLQ